MPRSRALDTGRRDGRAGAYILSDLRWGSGPLYVRYGGFAKRSRITDYRLQSRDGLGIKTMPLANEERGNLVGAFIVVDGD